MTSFTSLKNWMLLALLFVAGQAGAQQVILSEDFSKCTSKDPDNPGTKMDDGMDPYTQKTKQKKKKKTLLHRLLICLMPRLHIH